MSLYAVTSDPALLGLPAADEASLPAAPGVDAPSLAPLRLLLSLLKAVKTMMTPTIARIRARALVAMPAMDVLRLVASPRRARAKPTKARMSPITPRVPAIQKVIGMNPKRMPTMRLFAVRRDVRC